jgi:4,5-dihydroxyphthalate decarboxylase
MRGHSLESLLADGHVDVAVGLATVPDGCQTLLRDPVGEARAWYEHTGLIPVNHLIALRSEHHDPGLITEICRMFEAAKRAFFAEIDSVNDGDAANGADTAGPEVGPLRLVTGLADPLPYGWSANEGVCGALIEAMGRQGMCDIPLPASALVAQVEPA